MASMRATETAAPVATAQARASPMLTSGSAGFAGGLRRAAFDHPVVSTLRVTTAAPTAEPFSITDQTLDMVRP